MFFQQLNIAIADSTYKPIPSFSDCEYAPSMHILHIVEYLTLDMKQDHCELEQLA